MIRILTLRRALVASALMLSSCALPPPPDPLGLFNRGRDNDEDRGDWPPPRDEDDDGPNLEAAVRRAYSNGFDDGMNDAHRGLTAEVLRHGARYHRAGLEDEYRAYSRGYSEGYRLGRGNAGPVDDDDDFSPQERAYYEDGYEAGLADRRAVRVGNHRRHPQSQVANRHLAEAFIEGYHDGYNRRPQR